MPQVVNLYTDELGSPEVPQKLKSTQEALTPAARALPRSRGNKSIGIAAFVLLLALAFGAWFYAHRGLSSPPASQFPAATSTRRFFKLTVSSRSLTTSSTSAVTTTPRRDWR